MELSPQILAQRIRFLKTEKSITCSSFIANLTLDTNMSTKIVDVRIDALNAACRQAWWIEIFTAQPKCTYYFGPFAGAWEAKVASEGFVEDLESEFAQGIKIQIDRRSQPERLTIEHDRIESSQPIELLGE